ncbi:MAG: outer membrane protein assembly factor [Chitinophagales bacterium]|nr:outer membrane protein assembly factor [Chitinophagales bacterium]
MNTSFKTLSLFIALFAAVLMQAQTSSNLFDYAKGGEYEIAEIRVEGAKYLDGRILLTLSGLAVGDKIKIPGDAIPKAIKTLWKQRLFTNVSIEAERITSNKIYLIIHVEERPRVSRYSLKGLKNSESEDLRKKLDLRAGQIFTENLRSITINTCKNYFIDKGFLSVDVKVEEQPDTLLSNSVLVRITIDKGSRVKINRISFYGNHELPEAKLRSQMKETREKVKFDLDGLFRFRKNLQRDSIRLKWYEVPGILSPIRAWEYSARHINLNIFKTSKFKRDEYETDKGKIVDFYNTKGFRDARIVRDSVYFDGIKDMYIDIVVDEGRKYYFRNIYYNGNTKYPDSLLAKIVNIKRGEVYNQKLLDERIFMNPNGGDLSSLYMDDGYLFFSVTPLEIKVEGDSIDIELRIHEGAQATIRDVRIMGNTKTNEKVIRRELRTLPGNKFSRTDLIRSQREIVNLGYFDPAQLDVVPIPNPETGTVDIEYRVVEKPSDQFELSAGWGGQGVNGGLFGTVGVNFTNFSIKNIIDKKAWSPLPSGDGQRLGIRINSNGRIYQSYSVSFTEPWLGGKKPLAFDIAFNRLRANTFGSTTDVNKITGKYISTSVYMGITTRLKRPDDFFTFSTGLEFQHYLLSNYNTVFVFSDGKATNLNLQLAIARDSREMAAPTFYNKGIYFMLQGKFTLPYSHLFNSRKNLDYTSPTLSDAERYRFVEYHKWKILFEWYMPVWKNLVVKTSANMSFLGYYNSKIGYSPFERVEFGGDGLSNLNMGTQMGRDIISMRGYPILTPTGGSPIYNKFSLELRYPISLNQSATIYALVFADAGNYWNRIRDYKPYDLARSAGVGVRVFLPMFGLLGFDYGFGFDKQRYGLETPGKNIFAKYGAFRIVLGREPE